MPVTAAPGASAGWSALPSTARPPFERIFERLARQQSVPLTHEKGARWSARFGVPRGKTFSARGSKRGRVYLVREAAGYKVLGFGDRAQKRLYRR